MFRQANSHLVHSWFNLFATFNPKTLHKHVTLQKAAKKSKLFLNSGKGAQKTMISMAQVAVRRIASEPIEGQFYGGWKPPLGSGGFQPPTIFVELAP